MSDLLSSFFGGIFAKLRHFIGHYAADDVAVLGQLVHDDADLLRLGLEVPDRCV